MTSTKLSIGDLLRQGVSDIGVFLDCETCAGQGSYPVSAKGGAYGCDMDSIQACPKCYERSGQRLERVPLSSLEDAFKKLDEIAAAAKKLDASSEAFLLHLVDVVWGVANEDESVPSTDWAKRMIQTARYTFKQEDSSAV